jgi:phosphohistidine phosphatase SixA
VPIFLVRHAKAGSRSTWEGDDMVRPLTQVGLAQSKIIAERLLTHQPSVLLSSPYVRCVQTLEPLAEISGLKIVIDERLTEESPLEKSLAVLEDVPDNAVLCSHGDVIPDLVNGLIRRGMEVDASMRSPRKGSIIVLHHVNKLFTHAEYWDRPTV